MGMTKHLLLQGTCNTLSDAGRRARGDVCGVERTGTGDRVVVSVGIVNDKERKAVADGGHDEGG